MQIRFTTNIDAYKTNCFPDYLKFVPRKGELVSVIGSFRDYFFQLDLPRTLEVIQVTYEEDFIICELHYRKIDIESAKQNGVNLYK